MLEKVIIENYKQFKNFRIDLNRDVNVIIGNNESGKTSLFEAINLALTCKLYGRPLFQELSPFLFNIEVINEYLDKLHQGIRAELPEILIELYFSDDLDSSFEGTNNSLNENHSGVYLKIAFDPQFQGEYEDYIADVDQVKTIPVEYYTFEWYSFANWPFKFTKVPMRSLLINNIEHRYTQGPDKYIANLIEFSLNKKQNAELALKYRKLKEEFIEDDKIKEINESFTLPEHKISDKKTEISIDTSAKNSWDSGLSLYLDEIPFKFVGKGEQNSIKTKLAIRANAESSNIIMIEEPETSLSFSNLNKLTNYIKENCTGKQLLINTHSSFVLNKSGLDKAILMNGDNCFRIQDLEEETYTYFKKLPGYDTLRMILAKKAILVEGPSDELIVQKAYKDVHGKLPIEDGIDVISVRGLAFKRFLDIAKEVKNPVSVITDNDGNLEALKAKYSEYQSCRNINIFYSDDIQYKTLEPQIIACNDIANLKSIFNKTNNNDEDFKTFFESKNNKTDVALKIFETEIGAVVIPQYIKDAIE